LTGLTLVDKSTDEFLSGAQRRQLLLRQCEHRHYSEPVAQQCATCGSCDLEWSPAIGMAKVVSWATSHARISQAGQDQLTVVAIGELVEGPWYWSQVLQARPEEMAEGRALLVDFLEFGTPPTPIPVFRLA
jgi:uncharacterized protein